MKFLLVIVNLLLFLFLAPLFEGVIRRIVARVQSRKGPPLMQPFYDLLKLLGKDNMDSAGSWPFRCAPMVALASILTVVAALPVAQTQTALSPFVDVITIIALLTIGGVAVLLGAISSRNTYALMGASREMITMIMIEPLLAMALMPGVVQLKSLNITEAIYGASSGGYSISLALMLVVYLLALQAFVARQPFDIPEAEIELLGGPFIEYSGPNLALFKYYLMIKQMFYAYLLTAIFLPLPSAGGYLFALCAQLLGTLAVFGLSSLLASTHPRFRIDQAIKYYAVLVLVSFGAFGLSLYGY